jgi:hypothetical protein
MSVPIPTNNIGKVDIYIDDTIGIAVDINNNLRRVSNPLVIHAYHTPSTLQILFHEKTLYL